MIRCLTLPTRNIDYSGYDRLPKRLLIKDSELIDLWKIKHFKPMSSLYCIDVDFKAKDILWK